METFLGKFKNWKSDLDNITDVKEKQMILDTVQSCLRYVISSWTGNRFEIVTFGIKESTSSGTKYTENIQLDSFIGNFGILSSIKVEKQDHVEEDFDNNDMENDSFYENDPPYDEGDDQPNSLGVKEEVPELKSGKPRKAKRTKKKSSTPRKKQRKKDVKQKEEEEEDMDTTGHDTTGDDDLDTSKNIVFGEGKWNVEVIHPASADVKYFCTICEDGTTWTEKEPFVEHFRDKHLERMNDRWELTCKTCKKRFKRSGPKVPFSGLLLPFINHQMEKHNIDRPDYCKYYRCKEHEHCSFTSVVLSLVYRHIKVLDKEKGVFRNPESRIVCDICGREMLVGSLKTHLQTCSVSLEERKKFECETCKMKFCARHILDAHIARKHEKTKSFICTKCADQFFLKYDLVRHMWVHHRENISGRPLGTCETCGYQTIDGVMLKKHKQTHLDENHVCSFCQKVFKNRLRLDSHTRLVHGFPRPEVRKKHPCPHCTYVAGKGSHLKRHLSRKHSAADGAFPERYESQVPTNNDVLYHLPMEMPPHAHAHPHQHPHAHPHPHPHPMYVDMPQSALDPTYILGPK